MVNDYTNPRNLIQPSRECKTRLQPGEHEFTYQLTNHNKKAQEACKRKIDQVRSPILRGWPASLLDGTEPCKLYRFISVPHQPWKWFVKAEFLKWTIKTKLKLRTSCIRNHQFRKTLVPCTGKHSRKTPSRAIPDLRSCYFRQLGEGFRTLHKVEVCTGKPTVGLIHRRENLQLIKSSFYSNFHPVWIFLRWAC